jgi:hypothetical protein
MSLINNILKTLSKGSKTIANDDVILLESDKSISYYDFKLELEADGFGGGAGTVGDGNEIICGRRIGIDGGHIICGRRV